MIKDHIKSIKESRIR